jgi:hypothetical protein
MAEPAKSNTPIVKAIRAGHSVSGPAFHAVVRGFLRDDDVMGMAFSHRGR